MVERDRGFTSRCLRASSWGDEAPHSTADDPKGGDDVTDKKPTLNALADDFVNAGTELEECRAACRRLVTQLRKAEHEQTLAKELFERAKKALLAAAEVNPCLT